VIWRTGALLAAILLPVAVMGSPVANAAPQATACPAILFLGAHGVDEGSPSGGSQPVIADWGPEVQTVWDAFSANGVDATAEAVNFPEVKVHLPTSLGGLGFPAGAGALVTFGKQVLSIKPATNAAAEGLADQLWNAYFDCGASTSFVLAGYSQGAWVIDMALRQLVAAGTAGKAVLADTKGVFLMGDPAWPPTSQDPNREGIATWFSQGYGSAQSYLANGVSNFRSMCVSYPGGHFDPICLGLDPLKSSVAKQALASFTANICIHFSYASNANYKKQNKGKVNNCLGVTTGLSNGIPASGGNWLATLVGGSAG
jgi:hypothetical protein